MASSSDTGPLPPGQSAEPDSFRIYQPAPGELQLTVRAVLCGCGIGGLLAAMNVYMGLKTGWSEPGSLIAAILGFALFSVLAPPRPFSVLEANITQTAGSAAGAMASAAGLLGPIPALFLLDKHVSVSGLLFWSVSVGYLGVFFAVPLRRQYILAEKLRFPTGTATAETIVAMFGSAADTLDKSRTLVRVGLVSGAFMLATYFVPQAYMPPLNVIIPIGAVGVAFAWGFAILLSPLMFGAGILIGVRVGASLFAGAVVSWGVLGPIAQDQGWSTGAIMSYTSGPRGWILWPGVAIMVGDALMSLALSWRTFVRAFRPIKAEPGEIAAEDPAEAIPGAWWIGGLAVSTVLVVIVMWAVFSIPPYLTVVSVALSTVLAMIAVRSAGETDINPIGPISKVTQLVYGAIAPGQMTTNLMAAAITGAGASQSGDMMHDLKAGHMLGASPRRQFLAQLCGILSGSVFAVGAYLLLSKAYTVGDAATLPAPAAGAWAAVAKLLTRGLGALPPHATWAVPVGFAFGALIPLLRKAAPRFAPYLPSGLAFGIAFLVPAYFSVAMFLGAIVFAAWKRANPAAAGKLGFAIASGLIAGEGLTGLVNAVLTVLRVPTL